MDNLLSALWDVFVGLVALCVYVLYVSLGFILKVFWEYAGVYMLEHYCITATVIMMVIARWKDVLGALVVTALFAIYSTYDPAHVLIGLYVILIVTAPIRGLPFGVQLGIAALIGTAFGKIAAGSNWKK